MFDLGYQGYDHTGGYQSVAFFFGPHESAENAANKKVAKYALLSNQYIFQPLAFETLGPANLSAAEFLSHLGHRFQVETAGLAAFCG